MSTILSYKDWKDLAEKQGLSKEQALDVLASWKEERVKLYAEIELYKKETLSLRDQLDHELIEDNHPRKGKKKGLADDYYNV